jgi:hypothetical protein
MKADDDEMSGADKKIFIADRSASSSMSTRDILVRLRIPYEQNYKRKRHRTTETLRFWDTRAIVIREVEPEAAPLAVPKLVDARRSTVQGRLIPCRPMGHS